MQDFIDICGKAHRPDTGVSTCNAHKRVAPVRGDSKIFAYQRQGQDDPAWHDFDRARSRLHFDICYCSVFDACHRRVAFAATAERVGACVADPGQGFAP